MLKETGLDYKEKTTGLERWSSIVHSDERDLSGVISGIKYETGV